MRTTIERAVRRTSGGDLLVGVLATSLGVAVWFGVEMVATTRTMPLEVAATYALGVPLAIFLIVPALVGSYARVGRDEAASGSKPDTNRILGVPDGRLRETARLTVSTLRRRGRTLLAGLGLAILASLTVGVLTTVVLHAVTLTLLTIAGYASYALGYGQLVPAVRMFHVSGLLVGLGLSIGVLSVRFFDCVVCWTDAGAVSSVRESLRFTRSRPLIVFGYTLVTAVLFALPSAAVIVLAELHEPLEIAMFVVVTSACVALYANVHAQVCHRHLLSVCCGTDPDLERSPCDRSGADTPGPSHAVTDRSLVSNPLAIALALLVVTALLVGSGSVRALDVRPTETPAEPGPIDEFDDPTTLVSPDAMPQTEVNHRAVETTSVYNDSADQWAKTAQFRYETDHQQRRSLVSFTTFTDDGEPSDSTTAYFSPKQFAMQWIDHQNPQPPSEPAERAWHVRTTGNWTVYSVSGFELLEGSSESVSTTPGFFEQDWQVVDESHDTITLAVSGSDAVPIAERGYGPIETAEIEVTIDRETGYVREISQELHREGEDVEPVRTHVEFEHWGDHDVERPDDIDVRAVEWIWGVASY